MPDLTVNAKNTDGFFPFLSFFFHTPAFDRSKKGKIIIEARKIPKGVKKEQREGSDRYSDHGRRR